MRALLVASLFVGAGPADDLWDAAKRGDVDTVKALLAKGAEVNAKTEYGATALHFAADKGHLEVVRVLLKNKADVNAKDTFYSAKPLDWAIMRSRVDVARELVEAGADGADAALRNAASGGNLKLMQALLGTGKIKQDTLDTTLSVTPASKKDVIELLTKAGAKLPPPSDKVDLTPYLGSYRSDAGFTIEMKASDGKLMAAFGKGDPTALLPAGKDTFKFGGDDKVLVVFARKEDKIVGLTFKAGGKDTNLDRVAADKTPVVKAPAPVEEKAMAVMNPANWPSFRGTGASGVADGQHPPITWDTAKDRHVRWKTPIPGLGHSCPVIWDDRIFITTAIGDPKATFKPGLYGDVDSVDDKSVHTWKVYCLDKRSGKILWEQTACQGVPKIKRHLKGSQASPTVATDGKHVIAFFASEGLYCYDVAGKPLWKSDLGVLSSGWFYDKDYEWGFGSSPIIYRDRVIIQCDIGKGSFIAAYRLADGQPIWKTPREEVPSWGTPTVVENAGKAELVTNATKFARGYDPETGAELWKLGKNSEITVPTPIFGHGLIFVTSGYRPVQPIYAIRPGAKGDLTLEKDKTTSDSIAWSTAKGGPYMPTPIIYGDHLYICSNAGIVTCMDAKTGKQVYRERLEADSGFTASPVAADGRLYFTSEQEGVFVVKAGPKFELLAVNTMPEVCMATPAISDGMIFVRGLHHVWAFGVKK
jgi:outer membrane protein assembly factor BamB